MSIRHFADATPQLSIQFQWLIGGFRPLTLSLTLNITLGRPVDNSGLAAFI
jgi:hypothetical protein